MKRISNLWEAISETDNIKLAFWKAARGKQDRLDVRKFRENFEDNIKALRKSLTEETYQLGNYTQFTIFDPKERTIHAAAFSERVIHHAIMNICEECFEKRLSGSVFACRKGYGQYAAIAKAQKAMRSGDYFLQLDIRKYFDSISHKHLLEQLNRIFKDKALLRFWENSIGSYQTETGIGLPIGSLTSQHLANYYLAKLDNWILSFSEVTGYVRYMDDFVIWSKDKAFLKCLKILLIDRLHLQHGLVLKQSGTLQPVKVGLNFLGYRVFANRLHLNRRSRRRYQRKSKFFVQQFAQGKVDEQWLQSHLQPLSAFASKGTDRKWRKAAHEKIWAQAIGL